MTIFLGFPQIVPALIQVNQVLLVDDYDQKTGVNRLGGITLGNSGLAGEGESDFVTGEKALGQKGASLLLEYDVTRRNSFFYFWSKLGRENPLQGTSEVADLTGMRYLSFWMKPDLEKEGEKPQFYIEIHEDTDEDERFILGRDLSHRLPISRFIGSAPGGWQKVVVPLAHFGKIRRWERVLEIAFVFESDKRLGRGRLFIDDLLFGSNYPEGFNGKEISMQNRVSSFKIGNRIANREMNLKTKKTSLALTLTFVDPYLEEIRFEESGDHGLHWEKIGSFYDHSGGGTYSSEWEIPKEAKSKEGVWVQAVGIDVLGGETQLAGPYRIALD